MVPWEVADPAECYWYHAFDLPGIGDIPGGWDLRGTIDAYLGGASLEGLTFIDLADPGQVESVVEGARRSVGDLPGDDPIALPWPLQRIDRLVQHPAVSLERGHWRRSDY